MRKNNILFFLLGVLLLFSLLFNINFLIPRKPTHTVTSGYYVSWNEGAPTYSLSITEDNEVYLYDHTDTLLLNGDLSLDDGIYLITVDSNVFQIVAEDDTLIIPFEDNGIINLKYFTKLSSGIVTRPDRR